MDLSRRIFNCIGTPNSSMGGLLYFWLIQLFSNFLFIIGLPLIPLGETIVVYFSLFILSFRKKRILSSCFFFNFLFVSLKLRWCKTIDSSVIIEINEIHFKSLYILLFFQQTLEIHFDQENF